MKVRSLLAVFAASLCLLLGPHDSNADPAPTTRPAPQGSDGGPHHGNGVGRGPDRGPGPGGRMGPMQRGLGGGPGGEDGAGQFMQRQGGMRGGMRGGMQDRGQSRDDDDGVDQQTIAKLQSQIEKLSAQLDRMQKQLDEREGGAADRGRHGNQKMQRKSGKGRDVARRQEMKRGWSPSFRGPRPFQQRRSEQFAPRRGGPRGWMQPDQQSNRGRFSQSPNYGRPRGFGPMNGGPRRMGPPAFMQRFGPSYGRNFQDNRGGQPDRGDGYNRGEDRREYQGPPNERGWRSPRYAPQFNGYRQPPGMNRQRWNGRESDGDRGYDRMNDGPGPRQRQDDRGQNNRDWNDNPDGRPAPDFAGPRGFQQHRQQNRPEDDSQPDGGPRFRDGDSSQR